MPSWNVKQYELYENERLRPALDLLNAIPITPSTIVDVGCGTGNVTSIIKDRWLEEPSLLLPNRYRYNAMIGEVNDYF